MLIKNGSAEYLQALVCQTSYLSASLQFVKALTKFKKVQVHTTMRLQFSARVSI